MSEAIRKPADIRFLIRRPDIWRGTNLCVSAGGQIVFVLNREWGRKERRERVVDIILLLLLLLLLLYLLTCECGNEPSGSIKCGEFLD
jgi:hypothetical protein